MGDTTLPRTYRGEPGGKARWFNAVLISLGLLLLELWTLPAALWVRLSIGAVLVGVMAVLLAASLRSVTMVDHQGISVRGLRGTRLAWTEIHDIRTVPVPNVNGVSNPGPATCVYAYRTDGHRVLLPRVDDRELANLPAEVTALRSLLEERRGPDWTPDPEMEAHIARRAETFDRRFRFFSGWKFAGLTVLAIAVVVAFTGTSTGY
ncbi:PH domain-containing protein [Streptomyces sp. NPDC089799]|uniref:PH domain-containing protein n=1 Tax=Streptomyces sp. NPDC089799 TaxID=3155066 RepID=UPI00343CD5D2